VALKKEIEIERKVSTKEWLQLDRERIRQEQERQGLMRQCFTNGRPVEVKDWEEWWGKKGKD
jgi:hypothetical protein